MVGILSWNNGSQSIFDNQWNPKLDWREVDFYTSMFRVQVHSLPTLWKSEENLRKIGSHASIVSEVDVVGDGGSVWKKFIRIKVEVDLS